MKLTFRFRFLAAASVTLAAGLIGCQLHRGHNTHGQGRNQFVTPVEPVPADNEQLPLGNPPQPQTPVLTPPGQVPPSEDEDAVPTAGLTPIQRTCFFSTKSCNSCPSCPSPCGSSWKDKLSNKWQKDKCMMKSAGSHFSGLFGKKGCSTCSTCNSYGSYGSYGGYVSDGYVVGDVGYPDGMWAPAAYGQYPYQQQYTYAPQAPVMYQPVQVAQPPCNCQQNQTSYPQQYSYIPQHYSYAYQQPFPAPQPYYQPQYQQQYAPQQYVPQAAPQMQPGYSQPSYPTPAAQPQVPQLQQQIPAVTVPTPVAPQVPGLPQVPGAS